VVLTADMPIPFKFLPIYQQKKIQILLFMHRRFFLFPCKIQPEYLAYRRLFCAGFFKRPIGMKKLSLLPK
jgi:hypothetical protein